MTQRIAEFEKLALKAKPNQLKEDTKDFIWDNFKILFWSGLTIFLGSILLFRRLVKNKNRKGNNG